MQKYKKYNVFSFQIINIRINPIDDTYLKIKISKINI